MSPTTLPMDEKTVYLLQLYGTDTIEHASIASTPIQMNEINTPIRHVFLILTLGNTILKLEKNDRVELSMYCPKEFEDKEKLDIVPCTLSSFLYHGIVQNLQNGKSLSYFWTEYDLLHNNCQQFVFGLIKANQWLHTTRFHNIKRFNQEAHTLTETTTEYISKQYKTLPFFAIKLIVHSILQYASSYVRRNHSPKDHSEYVTANGIDFHTYPHCTPEECYKQEEVYIL